MQTQSQKRAKFALEKVTAITEKKDEFVSLANGATTMILQNGLGQALAFWMTKSKNSHFRKLLDIVEEWNREKFCFLKGANGDREFIEKLEESTQQQYLLVQRETLALLEWVKRFAVAFLKQNREEEKNNEDSYL
jgi:CRISPR-associated protein Cmr5